MKLLALETTGPFASVAYWEDGLEAPVQKTAPGEFSHLQSTLPLAQELLQERGVSFDQITHVACSRGPGSFTGIRIGMTAARTLGQVWNVPVIAVPTLESFAYKAPVGRTACPVLDARRQQVYGGAYCRTQDGVETLVPEGAYDLTDYLAAVEAACEQKAVARETLLFYGDGLRPYGEAVARWLGTGESRLVPEGERYQEAAAVARLAKTLIEQGRETSWQEAQPVYLRKAEAERKLPETKQETLEQAADVFTAGAANRGIK